MKNGNQAMRTWQVWIICIIVAVLGVSLGRFSANVFRGETTTSLLSPDESLRAVLVESSPRFIDRNFRIELESVGSDERQEIFRSPDEGMPIGTERFLWSRDGTRLLLLGRHFKVESGSQLQSGESLYLLYDVPTGKLWCNATQAAGPRFGAEELAGYDFGEPLVLQQAAGGEQPNQPPPPMSHESEEIEKR